MTQDSGERGTTLGRFRINSQNCVGCRTCDIYIGKLVAQAGTINYFKRQPESEEERMACLEAMDKCPTNAIEIVDNKDGDKPDASK